MPERSTNGGSGDRVADRAPPIVAACVTSALVPVARATPSAARVRSAIGSFPGGRQDHGGGRAGEGYWPRPVT